MKYTCCRVPLAGLATVLVFGLVLLTRWPGPADSAGSAAEDSPPAKQRADAKPIAMPANLVGVEIELGRKDKQPVAWDGEVQVSEGRILEVIVSRAGNKAR